jgi:hypothetical protein
MTRLLVPVGLALASAAGCASPSTGPIDFHVSGGFAGGGDGTAIHIETSGTATRTSRTDGTVTEQIDPVRLATLQGQIRDAQFPALAPQYECLSCADVYVYTVIVELDGASYTVAADNSQHAGEPDALVAVIDTLKQLAHSH